jgi:hypothetical protein
MVYAPLGHQRCSICTACPICVPRHGRADAVGQGLQEGQIALGELSRLGASDLKHPECLLPSP